MMFFPEFRGQPIQVSPNVTNPVSLHGTLGQKGGVNDRDQAQGIPHDATGGPRANPTALGVADAARLMSAAGGQLVTPEQIQSDIDAGAPTNADGTINLVHYAAWLVKEMSSRGD